MIKVFTSGKGPNNNAAGNDFQEMIDEWIGTISPNAKIANIHSNSNEYGWMIVIQYETY
jgi:hypothetical protein